MLLRVGLPVRPSIHHRQKTVCGCRRMPECFVKVNMYQGANQIEYFEKKLRYTKRQIKKFIVE